jgi:hypothetical protein
MASPETATPAAALCVKPAPIVDHSFAGEIDAQIALTDLRAQCLRRIFALSAATAAIAFAVLPR